MNYPDIPDSGSKYLKLKDGDNKIRKLGDNEKFFVYGIEWWTPDKKPVRVTWENRQELEGKEKSSYFWAFPVWDYKEEEIKIALFTQKSILKPLRNLGESTEWGELSGYDVVINRSGEELKTTYTVMPSKPTELSEEAKKAWKEVKNTINLNAIFDGGDPFGEIPEEAPETEEKPEKLAEEIEEEGEIDISDIDFGEK